MALIQKAFSDIITFSRSSNATRVGPTGLVEYAPHNLVLRSQEFDNASWTKDSCTASANAIAAPDGTVTADLITSAAATAQTGVSQTVTVAAAAHTLSCYIKPNGVQFVQALWNSPASSNYANFDISAGTVTAGTYTSATITSVGNGWYRITITSTLAAGSAGLFIWMINNGTASRAASFTGNGSAGYYLWGAQLSVGPYALDYTPTTSAAVYGPRFDYDGSGVTNVEPVSTNLLTYSEQFDNAAWSKTRSSVSANAAVAPDGTVTADTMIEDTTATNSHVIYQSASLGAGVYTASCYFKKNTRSFACLRISTNSDVQKYSVTINLDTGAFGSTSSDGSPTNTSYSIVNAGNDWYRLSVTTAHTSGLVYVTAAVSNAAIPTYDGSALPIYTGDGTSGIYLWGAQLEVGSTATAYMVSGATNGFRAVPVVSGSATARGLLVEEQRTNLLTYSEQFDNAAWGKTRGSVTANATTSPDGTVNADAFIENTATGEHYLSQGGSVTSGSTYTFSIFAKSNGTRNWFAVSFGGATATATTFFNVATGILGTVAANASATITNVGNNWYRCSITITTNATTLIVYPLIATANGTTDYTGDGTSGIYLWGAQLEAGSFATSYIPTLASTVTRSADVASVNTLSPWWNATESTIYSEFDTFSTNDAFPYALGTKNNNEVDVYRIGSNGNVATLMFTSTVLQNNSTIATGTALNATIKAAYAIKANDLAGSANGGAAVTDTTATLPSVSTLYLGARDDGTGPLNGHLRRLAVYPRRLTNAEIQALTS